MSDESIKELFFNLAAFAIDRGLEVRLENSRDNSTSGVLGGNFSKSVTDRNGLSLYVYQKDMSDEAAKDDEDDEDDEEDPDDE